MNRDEEMRRTTTVALSSQRQESPQDPYDTTTPRAIHCAERFPSSNALYRAMSLVRALYRAMSTASREGRRPEPRVVRQVGVGNEGGGTRVSLKFRRGILDSPLCRRAPTVNDSGMMAANTEVVLYRGCMS